MTVYLPYITIEVVCIPTFSPSLVAPTLPTHLVAVTDIAHGPIPIPLCLAGDDILEIG